MQKQRILFDAWPLAYAPNAPATLHLLTLLEASSEMIEPILALPASLPNWMNLDSEIALVPQANTQKNRSRWVQRTLPDLAKRHQANTIHIVGADAPLNSPFPVFISPADEGRSRPTGFGARIRAALGQGGVSQGTLLWAEDMAAFAPPNAVLVPPIAPLLPPPTKLPKILEDEDTFILVHAPNDLPILKKIVDMWSWAHDSIGAFFPLVFVGLTPESQGYVRVYLESYDAAESAYLLPTLPLAQLSAIYTHCTAVFHPTQAAPWGDAVRLALAYGKPLISFEHPEVEAVVGPAGFLLEDNKARTLAGGVIAITNKENIAEELKDKAKEQSAKWEMQKFKATLADLYQNAQKKH